jgi:hypothetical protein
MAFCCLLTRSCFADCRGVTVQQTNDLDSAESRSANAALGLALAENYRSSSLGTDGMHHSLSLGADGVRSLSLSSTGTAHYLGLVRARHCTLLCLARAAPLQAQHGVGNLVS